MKSYVFGVPVEKGGGRIIVMAEDEESARKRISEYYSVLSVEFLTLEEVF